MYINQIMPKVQTRLTQLTTNLCKTDLLQQCSLILIATSEQIQVSNHISVTQTTHILVFSYTIHLPRSEARRLLPLPLFTLRHVYILRKPDGQQVYPLGIPKYLRLFSFFKAINYYLVQKNPYTEFELLKNSCFCISIYKALFLKEINNGQDHQATLTAVRHCLHRAEVQNKKLQIRSETETYITHLISYIISNTNINKTTKIIIKPQWLSIHKKKI